MSKEDKPRGNLSSLSNLVQCEIPKTAEEGRKEVTNVFRNRPANKTKKKSLKMLSMASKYMGSSMRTILQKRKSVARQNAKDDENRTEIPFPRLLVSYIGPRILIHLLSIGVVVVWACVCTWLADCLREEAEQNPGGNIEKWLGWIEEVEVKVIGALFTFSLVFQFNQCYT
eukprot:398427-Ditylum_brightwellii.AAC.1